MFGDTLLDQNIRYNEIKNTIKIWPYLDDFSQAIVPYSDRYLSNDKHMVVNLDFSNVVTVNSSGAAITLKKLISLFFQTEKQRLFRIVPPKNKKIDCYLRNIGFYSLLDNYLHFSSYSADLFNNVSVLGSQNDEIIVIESNYNTERISFPIFRLKFDRNDERASVQQFSDWFNDIILCRLDRAHYDIKTEVLFSVLTEIAKNSQDHTEKDAFWGFDLFEDHLKSHGELLFSCSDLGDGIAQTVRNYLISNPSNQLRSDVWKHGSLTDYYKWAFTLGNSTSKKISNKGIGMTMIIDGAHELNMDLSFCDAKSLMQIPDSLRHSPNALNHEELRRKAWNTENKVGFYYFGRLKF